MPSSPRVIQLSIEGRHREVLSILDDIDFSTFGGPWSGGMVVGLSAAYAAHSLGDEALTSSWAQIAIEQYEEKLESSPMDHFSRRGYAQALALAGRHTEAIREALMAAEGFPISKDAMYGMVMTYGLGRTYAIAGEADKALDQVELLLSIPSGVSIHDFRHDPAYRMVSDHPRFQRLLREHGVES